MRAYQVKLKGQNFGVPFIHHNEMKQMLDKMKDQETMITVQMVEIVVDDYYRTGNVIYMKDELNKGVVKGFYNKDQAESI